MCVRTTIRLGRSLVACAVVDRRLDAVEADVLAEVLHVPAVGLEALAATSSEKASAVSPSIEMWLSS